MFPGPGVSRGNIFDLYWDPASARQLSYPGVQLQAFDSSLFRTCRQVFLESCHLLFEDVVLRFTDGMTSVSYFTEKLQPRHWPWARSLRHIGISDDFRNEMYGMEALWTNASSALSSSAILGGVTTLDFHIIPRLSMDKYLLVAGTPRHVLSRLARIVRFEPGSIDLFFPGLLPLQRSTVTLFQDNREIREEDLPDDCQLKGDFAFIKNKILRSVPIPLGQQMIALGVELYN